MYSLKQLPQKLNIPTNLRMRERGLMGKTCSVNRDCPKGKQCRPTGHGCCNHAPKRCM